MKKQILEYKRKRNGKTNYKKRLNLLLSEKPRLVIRKSNRNIIVQLVDYDPKGDKILASSDSRMLIKHGWKSSRNNIPAAYLTGLILGKKAVTKKIKEAVLDIGLQKSTKGARIYAALKGVVDAGINIAYNKDILPEDARIEGKHIEEHAKKLKAEQSEIYSKLNSGYIKQNIDPEKLSSEFSKLKEHIIKNEKGD